MDLDLDVDVDRCDPHTVNFRKLDVYQSAVRFLPLAAGVAALALIDVARADEANQVLISIVRMLSKMCRD